MKLATPHPSQHSPIITQLLFSLFATAFLLLAENTLPTDEHFRVHSVADGFVDAMEIAVNSDGDFLVIERTGAIKLAEVKSWKVKTIATVEVAQRKKEHARKCRVLGINLDPKFAQNNWIHLYYSLKKESEHRLARFTFSDNKLVDEKIIKGGVGVWGKQPMPPSTAQHRGYSANAGNLPAIPSQIALPATHHFLASQLNHLSPRKGFQPLPLKPLIHQFGTC